LQADKYANIKVFRQCTDVRVYQTSRQLLAVSNSSKIQTSVFDMRLIDRLIASGGLIKDGRTCTVSRLKLDHNDIVLKRYNIKNIWHAISRAFRQTRASASWGNAHRLNILGIATPKPVALIEKRFWRLRGKAYYVSEYVDAPDVKEFFSQVENKYQQAFVIENIVKLFYRLYLLKLSHGDMKSSNIKVLDGFPLLIDLDSMCQHRFDYFALKAHVEDLRRFMLNWQDQSTLYNTFVKEFLAVYPDHDAIRLAGLIY
jgi:tRNA A-37 threonylcarbamoyl transferase component Bud32